MRSNWVTAFSTTSNTRQSRFDEPEGCWLEMQQRMNRWGGGHTWDRLQQLGAIAKTGG